MLYISPVIKSSGMFHNIMFKTNIKSLHRKSAINFSTEPAIISLTSFPSSSVMTGDTVTLTCSVTLPTGVTGTPDFHWEGPGVTPPAEPTTDGQKVSSILKLGTISTSQAGQYTCTATLNGSSITNTTTITVQGECVCHSL